MSDPGWQPVGAILPVSETVMRSRYSEDEYAWNDWMLIDGQKLDRSKYPELAEQLTHRSEAFDIWKGLGGDVNDEFIIMPPLLSFPEYPNTMVLIKVQ